MAKALGSLSGDAVSLGLLAVMAAYGDIEKDHADWIMKRMGITTARSTPMRCCSR